MKLVWWIIVLRKPLCLQSLDCLENCSIGCFVQMILQLSIWAQLLFSPPWGMSPESIPAFSALPFYALHSISSFASSPPLDIHLKAADCSSDYHLGNFHMHLLLLFASPDALLLQANSWLLKQNELINP